MARKFNTDVLKRSDGIGGFQGVPAMCGESSYDIARRNGFTGTGGCDYTEQVCSGAQWNLGWS